MAVKDDAAAGAASTTDGAAGDTGAADTKTGAAADTKTGDTKPGETKTGDTKTDTKTGDQGAKTGGKDDAATQQSKAPEKYALTLPDGGRLDAHDLATIETIARANHWTNEEAQQRVNDHAAAITAQSDRFTEDTKQDAVYGGAHLPETLTLASRALDTLRPKGTPRGDAFRALLDKSGYGNHLEVVSLLADLGKAMAEDGNAGGFGGGTVAEPKDLATAIYGSGPQVKS